jgi:hypothetical protein
MGSTEILDGFAQGDAFFRLQAVMAGANQPNFAEVESENPKLQKQIAAFDRTTTLSAVAALMTYPPSMQTQCDSSFSKTSSIERQTGQTSPPFTDSRFG